MTAGDTFSSVRERLGVPSVKSSFVCWMSVLLTLGSSIFLLKANMGLTPRAILELSSMKWDDNPDVVANLADQRADTMVGLALILLAFAFQVAADFWLRPSESDRRDRIGLLLAFVAVAAVLVVAWIGSATLSARFQNGVERLRMELANAVVGLVVFGRYLAKQ